MNIENKKFLDNILRNSPTISIFFVDINCKIEYANNQFTKLMGYKNPDEILGKELEEILCIHSSHIKKVIETKNAIINRMESIIDKNGNEMYFSISCVPITDEKSGKVTGAYELLSDITESQKKEMLINDVIKNIPSPTKILVVDTNCNIQYANNELAKFRGYDDADEIINKTPEDILGIKHSIIRNFLNTNNTPIINQLREPLLDKDNNPLCHIISIIPLFNRSSKIIGALETLNDVTELLEQKRITEEIIMNMPYPVDLAFFDQDRKLQYADTGYMQLIGCENIDEVKGKDLNEILTIDDEKKLILEEVFETKEPIINKEITILPHRITTNPESHQLQKDNLSCVNIPEMDCNLLEVIYSCIPLLSENGKMLGVIESFTDVTKIKSISKELKIQKEMYSSLIDSIDCSVYLIDRNCTYLYVNPHYLSRFKGLKIDEVIGRSYDEFHTIEDSKEIKNKIEEIFNTGNHLKYTYHSKKDNKYFDRILSPVRDNEGRVFAVTVFSSEITELKNTQKNLIMKNEELESYAYTVAHDLRTPLITIQGFANMIEESIEESIMQNNKKDIGENIKNIKYIKKAISRMDELLSDTLKLSSIDYDKNSYKMVPFNNIVINVIEQLRKKIETEGIQLITARTFPLVFVNKSRIIEVLVNLIENSIKYIGVNNQNPIIEIGYREKNGNFLFFVKDNGIGINPNQHEKIFKPFYKINANTEGTGMGLAIAKKIINSHNGEIWVESEPGKGATFFFTLPMHNEPIAS